MFSKLRTQLKQLKAKRDALERAYYPASGNSLLPFYARIMTKATECERCSIFILDPERSVVWLKTGTGVEEHGIEVSLDNSVVGQAIDSGDTVVVSNLEIRSGAHKEVDKTTGFVSRNILCVPIFSPTRDEVTGAFQLLNKKNNQEFNDDDISLAKEIALHLQKETDSIFLDQEIFGAVERFLSAARKTVIFLVVVAITIPVVFTLILIATGLTAKILG